MASFAAGIFLLVALQTAIATAAPLPPPAAPEDSGGDAARMLRAARVPDCVCEEERLELAHYRDAIAAAASADEAREKAARPSRLARRALALGGFLRHDDGELERVRAQLTAYEARVAQTETPEAAAEEFEGLVRLAGGADVRIGGNGGCSYTTPEIIAIVFGFLLFIIPGIILLIVFC